jgi:hypothetical protein
MPATPPLICETFPNCGVESVRGALSGLADCPLLLFLEQVIGCTNIRTSGWKSCPDNSGHKVRKSVYTMPAPSDIPASVRKILGVPEFLQGTTVQRLCGGEDEITHVQQSYSSDILYGDRFMIQAITHFAADKDGGVLMRQWIEPIWTRSLPWTHGVVKVFADRKARAEAVATSADFTRIVGTAVGRYQAVGRQSSHGGE